MKKVDLDNIWVRMNESNTPSYFFHKSSDVLAIVISNVDYKQTGSDTGGITSPNLGFCKKLSLPEIIAYRLQGILKL